ncbi:MAG: UDP-N-acetylmuramoyl-tripeptide--D-alanyl-D-alanine ligase, partial [Nocardioidaceae bacterium]
MIALTLVEVAEITGGTVLHAPPTATVTAPPTVDSRAVEPGALFVAIDGERVDGHDFASRAVTSGAVAALASRDVGVACVVVEDTVRALGQVAAAVTARLTGCTVVGITGSQGKTGTKDLLDQLLGRAGETVATRGNFNNEIGVPLTTLRATEATRFLVVEMGARRIGNIADLCRIARPTVGVVLNVGVSHLGEFGTRENIARAKGELAEAVPAEGTVVLNADDEAVAAMAGRTRARVVTFGADPGATVGVRDLRVDAAGEPRFTLEHAGERVSVHLTLLGEHQAYNAAAAAAVALSLGLPLGAVAEGLGAAETRSSWR